MLTSVNIWLPNVTSGEHHTGGWPDTWVSYVLFWREMEGEERERRDSIGEKLRSQNFFFFT